MQKTSETKIPFLLFDPKKMGNLSRRVQVFGSLVEKINPSMKGDLKSLGVTFNTNSFVLASLLSAALYGLMFFVLAYLFLFLRHLADTMNSMAIGLGFLVFFLFFILHIIYPKILRKKVAIQEDQDLLFALREMLTDLNSGITLFDAIKNVSQADYGYVSADFQKVVEKVEHGAFIRDALRDMIVETESTHLRRVLWQIVSSLESGSSVNAALDGIAENLESRTYRKIRDYSANLNFIMLIYMLVAAAIPSLGVTFLVLLSLFSGGGVDAKTIITMLIATFILQMIIIGYANATRPRVFGA